MVSTPYERKNEKTEEIAVRAVYNYNYYNIYNIYLAGRSQASRETTDLTASLYQRCRGTHHTLFTGGTLFTSEYCPNGETLFTGGGTLFTSEYCPGGHYSPVNSVRGDTSWGDSVHYGSVKAYISKSILPTYGRFPRGRSHI